MKITIEDYDKLKHGPIDDCDYIITLQSDYSPALDNEVELANKVAESMGYLGNISQHNYGGEVEFHLKHA